MSKTLIKNAIIVNEGKSFKGSITIEDDSIAGILQENETPRGHFDTVVDATGCFVLPGIIDDHVHFREPGMTAKADIESESRAAAFGGVTTFFDMPNTVPQTVTLEALADKFASAASESHINYSFFFGATNTNAEFFGYLDIHRIPGIKLFMGSSTGNMLVDRKEALDKIFATAPVPVMAHCEDTGIINDNMRKLSVILLGLSVLLMCVSFSLINNSVKLGVYSRRFLIHTMKLVGASWGFIRRPFLRQAVLIGLLASILACAALGGCFYALYYYEPEIVSVLTLDVLAITAGAVFLSGIVITAFCAILSVNKFLKMKAGDLYKI